MNKCPKFGNEDPKKYFVTGRTTETGEKYCDVCIGKRTEKNFFQKVKDKISGDNE